MATVVFLSLCAALAYGLSDFVGGLLTRRASAWAVAAASQATASMLTIGLVTTNAGSPDAAALLWAVIAGIGGGAGNVFIFRGLSGGRMAIVAPLSALAAASLPVLVGVAAGERPGLLPGLGVVAALPAIWLVSGGAGLTVSHRAAVTDGLLAGAGFGVQFSALGQIPPDAGLTPLAVSQVISVAAIVASGAAFAQPWLPRDRFSRLGVIAGLLAGLATIAFQLAVQSGLLTIAAVVTSLYPAVTVLLAGAVLRERIQRAQALGLVLALAAVALIASR